MTKSQAEAKLMVILNTMNNVPANKKNTGGSPCRWLYANLPILEPNHPKLQEALDLCMFIIRPD